MSVVKLLGSDDASLEINMSWICWAPSTSRQAQIFHLLKSLGTWAQINQVMFTSCLSSQGLWILVKD